MLENQLKEILTQLDLTEKEPKIYQTLLTLSGFHPASTIAKKSGINRSTTYKTLLKLSEKGLITQSMKHGIANFSTEDAELRLQSLIEKKEQKLKKTSDKLSAIIPVLKAISQDNTLVPRIRFYEGFDGIKKVYEDTILEKKTIYAFLNTPATEPKLNDWIDENYVAKRAKNKIYAYVLAPKNPLNKKYKNEDAANHRETKFFSEKILNFDTEINLYGHKTAIFSFKENEIFAAIIESAAVTNSIKALFDICWKIAK